MAIKQRSGIAVGLNKGHVSILHFLESFTNPALDGWDRTTELRWTMTNVPQITENRTPRIQTAYLAQQGPSQQAHCIREGNREGSFWVCLPKMDHFSMTLPGFASHHQISSSIPIYYHKRRSMELESAGNGQKKVFHPEICPCG